MLKKILFYSSLYLNFVGTPVESSSLVKIFCMSLFWVKGIVFHYQIGSEVGDDFNINDVPYNSKGVCLSINSVSNWGGLLMFVGIS